MDTTTIIGVSGALIILLLFVGNQMNKLKNDSFLYDLFNFIGSILLLVYSLQLNSIPFAILNLVWALFSLKDVIVKFLKEKNIKIVVE